MSRKSFLFILISFGLVFLSGCAVPSSQSSSTGSNDSAMIKYSLRDFQGAIKDLDQAIILTPNDAKLYYNRGCIKFEDWDSRGALQDLDKAFALGLSPDADAYYQRGMTKDSLHDYQGAIQDYNKVIELDPNDDNAYGMRGMAKYSLSDYASAIQDYDKLIELKPNDAVGYQLRGSAEISLNTVDNIDKGCKDLKKALDLGYPDLSSTIEEYCK